MHDEKKNGSCEVQDSYFERLNYYFGKLMTECDFRSEQKYMNEKRWLLNRLGIGWGVLCGLKVEAHETDKSKIIIYPGFAIDDSGREIRLEKPVCKDLKDVVIPGDKRELYISIKYCEFPAKLVPIPKEICGPSANVYLHNSIYESFKIVVSFVDKPQTVPEKTSQIPGCEDDCIHLIDDPCHDSLKEYHKLDSCKPIPLARVILEGGKCIVIKDIDSCACRKLAFSNEKLYEMIRCLKQELWKAHAAKYDRKQYVPLLAQTIRGIEYRDGRIKEICDVGKHPKRLTTDGSYIWITDYESKEIIRINKNFTSKDDNISIISGEKKPIEFDYIKLVCRSWGIAFDGQNMWITHPDANQITRINVCSLDKECIPVDPCPQEILFDGKYIWVSYGWPESEQPYVFQLTRIDPTGISPDETYTITPEDEKHTPLKPIVSMVWDGKNIWLAYKTVTEKCVAVMMIGTLEKGKENRHAAIEVYGDKLYDLTFDGTHILLSHDGGISKFYLDISKCPRLSEGDEDQIALAFDGSVLWALEKGYNEIRLNKWDTFSLKINRGKEIIHVETDTDFISKICYDGTYLWITTRKKVGKNRTGIIHRLLP